jgi:hypothetical protein
MDEKYFQTPQDASRNLHFLGLLWNDLILRLGKLREDDNRNWSFREVAKHLAKRNAFAIRAEVAGPVIAKYIDATKTLEIHRNRAVAHLTKQGLSDLRPISEVTELVRQAVEIADLLHGEVNSYMIDGVDLRRSVLGPK